MSTFNGWSLQKDGRNLAIYIGLVSVIVLYFSITDRKNKNSLSTMKIGYGYTVLVDIIISLYLALYGSSVYAHS